MSTDSPHKKEFSGKLLAMKFMQRQQERELREKLEKEQRKAISEAHWVLEYEAGEIEKPKVRVEYEPSYLSCTTTNVVGRKSFNNFNKEIEKIATDSLKEQRSARESEAEKLLTVDDKTYARRMDKMGGISNGTLRVSSPHKRQLKDNPGAKESDSKKPKRDRDGGSKREFIKPSD
ncbi:uncharacterized protein VTP21DRAFT_535 [Calcarisporiella thermophila]|uniref:uncharacterized protein n=1 Tax=Calcarisporiella thermophila TaxID=911321 RepID=UPI00374344D2